MALARLNVLLDDLFLAQRMPCSPRRIGRRRGDGDLPAVSEVPVPAWLRVVPGGVGLHHLAAVCRIGMDQRMSHPIAFDEADGPMRLTTAVDGRNKALIGKRSRRKSSAPPVSGSIPMVDPVEARCIGMGEKRSDRW